MPSKSPRGRRGDRGSDAEDSGSGEGSGISRYESSEHPVGDTVEPLGWYGGEQRGPLLGPVDDGSAKDDLWEGATGGELEGDD